MSGRLHVSAIGLPNVNATPHKPDYRPRRQRLVHRYERLRGIHLAQHVCERHVQSIRVLASAVRRGGSPPHQTATFGSPIALRAKSERWCSSEPPRSRVGRPSCPVERVRWRWRQRQLAAARQQYAAEENGHRNVFVQDSGQEHDGARTAPVLSIAGDGRRCDRLALSDPNAPGLFGGDFSHLSALPATGRCRCMHDRFNGNTDYMFQLQIPAGTYPNLP